jgi:hypothetical protein
MKIVCEDHEFKENLRGMLLESNATPQSAMAKIKQTLGPQAVVRLAEDGLTIEVKRYLHG